MAARVKESDTICDSCGGFIKDRARVVVTEVNHGYYRWENDSIDLDCDHIEYKVQHKECWMKLNTTGA